MNQFRAAIQARYDIVMAKSEIKLELEALADKLTSKDHYVILTKTKELKYDKALAGENNPKGLIGYGKKYLFNNYLEDEIKKAKFAHIVTANNKKMLSSDISIDRAKALRIYNKLDNMRTFKQGKAGFDSLFKESCFGREKANLSRFILVLTAYDTAEEKAKKLLAIGYNATSLFGDKVVFLDPAAYIVEHTYRLEIPKEETISTELTAEEKEILEKYAPDLGDPSSFHAPMPVDKIKAKEHKMSDDDLAWHILNSKKAMDIGNEDYIRNRLGFREICLLQLMNKNITKKDRTQIAEYMLDKMGVSFVGGPILKKYISALAKTGQIDAKIIKATKDDELTDAIYYGRIKDPDELRKIDYKKYDYQLANNPHTPQDVLEKIVEYHKKQKSDDWSNSDVKWSGSNPNLGGEPGESFSVSFSDTLRHPNYPLDKLLKVYQTYLAKYKNKPKAVSGMIHTLWDRPDLPKEMGEQLVKQVKSYQKPSSWPDMPPACFDEQEFTDYWEKIKKAKGQEDLYIPHGFVDHPHVPTKILKELLEDPEQKYAKLAIYKKLKERGALPDKDVISKVKKNLKFEGPDELLKEFGLQAYLGTKAKDKLKFTPVPSNELEALKKEMAATTVHDDFTFEVVMAYRVDKQIHKDYHKVAKDLGNVKSGLYHGTSMANAAGILASGINDDADSRTGQMFGAGFYLASSASKAAQYASDNFSKSGLGVVFKMDVALGKSAAWKYGRPEGDDFHQASPEDRQKMADYAKKKGLKDEKSIVPRWHLTHDSVHAKKGLALQHDEFVVKSGQQINITEIIVVHKEGKE